MNMVVCKLIFLNLVITALAVKFDYVNWDKTEAYMYAFYNLCIPRKKNHRNISKEFVYMYQNELWNTFYEVYENHIQFMFDDACHWYLGTEPKDLIEYEICKDKQKDYMKYVGPLIKKYVKYTSARGPSEFCNGIESSALPLPIDQNGNVDISLIVEEETQFNTNPNSQITSSSGVDKQVRDFDLNQLPLDED